MTAMVSKSGVSSREKAFVQPCVQNRRSSETRLILQAMGSQLVN